MSHALLEGLAFCPHNNKQTRVSEQGHTKFTKTQDRESVKNLAPQSQKKNK